MTIFVYDTFTGPAGELITTHTGEIGATWNTENGQFAPNAWIDGSGGLIVGGPTQLEVGASGVPPSPDYAVQVTYEIDGTLGPYGEFYLIAGFVDTGLTRYWVRCLFGSDGTVYADFSLPSATSIDHSFGTPGPTTGTHVARMEVEGSVMRVYIDSAQIGSDFNFGGVGLSGTGVGQAAIRMYDTEYPDPPVVRVLDFTAETITPPGAWWRDYVKTTETL